MMVQELIYGTVKPSMSGCSQYGGTRGLLRREWCRDFEEDPELYRVADGCYITMTNRLDEFATLLLRPGRDENDIRGVMILLSAYDADDETPEQQKLLVQRKWQKPRSIGPLQLLATLKNALHAEEPAFMFNYFGLRKRCFDILHIIKAREHGAFTKWIGHDYLPAEVPLPSLVSAIHFLAHLTHEDKDIKENLKPWEFTCPDGDLLVQRCGKLMEEYLKKNGSLASRDLRVFRKNKTIGSNCKPPSSQESPEQTSWWTLEDTVDPATLASLRMKTSLG